MELISMNCREIRDHRNYGFVPMGWLITQAHRSCQRFPFSIKSGSFRFPVRGSQRARIKAATAALSAQRDNAANAASVAMIITEMSHARSHH